MYINFNLILARIIKQIIVIKKIYPMKNLNPDIISINLPKIIIIVHIPPPIPNHIEGVNMKEIGEKIENRRCTTGGIPNVLEGVTTMGLSRRYLENIIILLIKKILKKRIIVNTSLKKGPLLILKKNPFLQILLLLHHIQINLICFILTL